MRKIGKIESLELLEKQISYIRYLKRMNINHKNFTKWYNDTEIYIKHIFRDDPDYLIKFQEIEFEPDFLTDIAHAIVNKSYFKGKLDESKELLESYKTAIEQFWPDDEPAKKKFNKKMNKPKKKSFIQRNKDKILTSIIAGLVVALIMLIIYLGLSFFGITF